MNKLLIIGMSLIMLVGCQPEPSSENVTQSDDMHIKSKVICVEGVKIWVGHRTTISYEAENITSQVIGVCENE